MTLEEILRKYFRCKKPFLKTKKLVAFWADGEPVYTTTTQRGALAYSNLISLLYDIQTLTGSNMHNAIEALDGICSEDD